MTGPDFSTRLAEVAAQPNGGAAASAALTSWLSAEQPFVNGAELRRFAELAPVGLIVDSFRCDIPFGTGGRRGRVGIGPNRINPRTLALTVAGHCEFLGASRIFGDARDDTGNPLVLSVKDCLEIEAAFADCHPQNRFTCVVHNNTTPLR